MVYADSAYRGDRLSGAVRAKCGQTAIVATGCWGREGDREDDREAEARFLA